MATSKHTTQDPSHQLTRSIYELVAAAAMWALVIAALVVLIGCSTAHAGDRMPREFQGEWCVAGDAIDDKVTEYRRGRCANSDSDWVLKIKPLSFEAVESGCNLRRIVASSRGLWIGAFKCVGEGNTWTATYAISIYRAGRLTKLELKRSEDKPEGAQ